MIKEGLRLPAVDAIVINNYKWYYPPICFNNLLGQLYIIKIELNCEMSSPNLYEKPPLQKTKGAVKNLTHIYIKYKHQEEYDPRDRYH